MNNNRCKGKPRWKICPMLREILKMLSDTAILGQEKLKGKKYKGKDSGSFFILNTITKKLVDILTKQEGREVHTGRIACTLFGQLLD